MDRPPKVADLELAVDPDEDVLGLDVAVDDVLGVEVRQGVGHLGDVLLRVSGVTLERSVTAAREGER